MHTLKVPSRRLHGQHRFSHKVLIILLCNLVAILEPKDDTAGIAFHSTGQRDAGSAEESSCVRLQFLDEGWRNMCVDFYCRGSSIATFIVRVAGEVVAGI